MVALFISFFPTISSGPIQRPQSLIPQLKTVHNFDYDSATDGLKLFVWGMFKKLCIADKIALYVNFVYGNACEQNSFALLLATILYSFQIYCDFSGYSDMAIGVARYFGFDVGKNFDHPYLSQSVGEFWRRWHISLSSWLRDYVYIPLGGSRVAMPRIYLNILITFFISGIWHGSGWNFIVWGLLHGFYLCAERFSKPVSEKIKIPAVIKIVLTFCLLSFAWIFFRATNFQEARLIVGKIIHIQPEIGKFLELINSVGIAESIRLSFSLTDITLGTLEDKAIFMFLFLGFISVSLITRNKSGLEIVRKKSFAIRWILYCILFLSILLFSNFSKNTDFLYFAF